MEAEYADYNKWKYRVMFGGKYVLLELNMLQASSTTEHRPRDKENIWNVKRNATRSILVFE